jgi:integrase
MKDKCYSFRLDYYKGHELKDGSYPVILVIRKDNKRKTINLPISAMIFDSGEDRWIVDKEGKRKVWNPKVKTQWNFDFQRFEVDKRRKDLHPDREKLNAWIEELSSRCEKVLEEFKDKRIDWTLNQFEQALLNRTKKSGVEAYFLQHIEKLDRAGKIGNKLCYEQTLNLLQKNDKDFSKRVFGEIDLKYVEKLNDFLDQRGQSGNTKKFYIKTLRSILNKAIKEKECSAASYPFGKDGFSIAALAEETKKRYLPSEYLEKLKTTKLDDPKLDWARNIFLFSYYCQGMAIVDVANLTTKNIVIGEKGKYIEYKRQKTENKNSRFIRIKITENIQALMEWANNTGQVLDDYLMPIVNRRPQDKPIKRKINKLTKHKPEYILTPEHQLHEHIRDRYKKYNKVLKDLGDALGFEGIRLSSYMSRHSYAMRLKNAGIPTDVISEAMGHRELSTTITYLDSFQNEEVDKANEVL